MKKFLLLFSTIALLLTSCSGDDENNTEVDSTLPKTITYNYPDFPEDNSKSVITYDGNKIVSVVENYTKTVFNYDGNLIVKQEQYRVDLDGKETLNRKLLYTYEDGKLKTRTIKRNFSADYPDGQYSNKIVYTHMAQDKISFINYDVSSDTPYETSEGTLEFKEGNLVKETQTAYGKTESRIYEYDAKNNPLKNIIGFDLLLNEISDFGFNNVVKVIKTNIEFSSTYKTEYIYNDKNYPIKHTSYTGDGESIEYEIEYTY